MTRARLGLIGAGRWGRNVIRTCRELTDYLSLTAVASRNPATRGLTSPECEVVSDWRDMLSRGLVDGVVLATPPALHAEMALEAIARRVAVLIEKPMTRSLSSAAEVEREANARQVTVMVDHIHLFNPAFRGLLAQAPSLGRMTRSVSVAGNRGPYRPDVLWDWGAHDLAMVLSLAEGTPTGMEIARTRLEEICGEKAENFFIRLQFESGFEAEITLGTLMDRCRRFTLIGDNGGLLYDDLAPLKLSRLAHGALEGPGEPIASDGDPPLSVVLREFSQALLWRGPHPSLALGVEVIRTLERLQELVGP